MPMVRRNADSSLVSYSLEGMRRRHVIKKEMGERCESAESGYQAGHFSMLPFTSDRTKANTEADSSQEPYSHHMNFWNCGQRSTVNEKTPLAGRSMVPPLSHMHLSGPQPKNHATCGCCLDPCQGKGKKSGGVPAADGVSLPPLK